MLFAKLERYSLKLTNISADTVVQIGAYEIRWLTVGCVSQRLCEKVYNCRLDTTQTLHFKIF